MDDLDIGDVYDRFGLKGTVRQLACRPEDGEMVYLVELHNGGKVAIDDSGRVFK